MVANANSKALPLRQKEKETRYVKKKLFVLLIKWIKMECLFVSKGDGLTNRRIGYVCDTFVSGWLNKRSLVNSVNCLECYWIGPFMQSEWTQHFFLCFCFSNNVCDLLQHLNFIWYKSECCWGCPFKQSVDAWLSIFSCFGFSSNVCDLLWCLNSILYFLEFVLWVRCDVHKPCTEINFFIWLF